MKRFFIYIMTNRRRTLYIGVTNDLTRRVLEHKQKSRRGFTRKYDMTMLAWFEEFYTADQAILAEKKIKGWLRSKKIALIESTNPDWQDLAASLQSEAPVIRSASPCHSEHSEETSSVNRNSRSFAPLRMTPNPADGR